MNKNKKHNVGIVNLIVLLTLALGMIGISSNNVSAGSWDSGGQGLPPTERALAHWWHEESDSSGTAWDKFAAKQTRSRNRTKLTSTVNGLSGVNTGGKSLASICKDSKYIFWWGQGPDWSSNGKYHPFYFFTQTSGQHNLWKYDKSRFRFRSDYGALQSFERAVSNKVLKSKTVLICSGSYDKPKVDITLRANSATRSYTGRPISVSGYTHERGKLIGDHKVDAAAGATRTAPGSTPAKFSKAEIVSGSTNVTNQYKGIIKIDGRLTVTPPVIIPVESEKCVDTRSDSAKSIVRREVTGSEGFAPVGSLNRTYETYTTSGGRARDSGVPRVNETYSSWLSWKSRFTPYDNYSPELDLRGAGVSQALSDHGGIYNITEEESYEEYSMTHCQPQESKTEIEWIPSKDKDGGETLTKKETITWHDVGPRIIKSMSGPRTSTKLFNYQNLVLNCNKGVFDSIPGTNRSVGDGTASGYLETAKVSGTRGPLESYRALYRRNTYTDGPSCRESLTCTSERLSGSANDAKNNRGTTPKFTSIDENGEHGEPKDKHELVFFRDNKDREVRADLWYPRLSRSVSDVDAKVGSTPFRTEARLYSGSPDIGITTIAPWENKDSKFTSNPGYKEWGGEVNKFTMKTQWASNDGKPYQLGVNWRYHVTMKNRAPATATSHGITGRRDYAQHNVNAICEFKNDNSNHHPSIPDTPFSNPSGASEMFTGEGNAIRTLFNRSKSGSGTTSRSNR